MAPRVGDSSLREGLQRDHLSQEGTIVGTAPTAGCQVGAGQWSRANGHLPSLSIALIVLSGGTEYWLNGIEIAYQTSKLILQSAATWSQRVPPTVREGKIISRRRAISGERASPDTLVDSDGSLRPSPRPPTPSSWGSLYLA